MTRTVGLGLWFAGAAALIGCGEPLDSEDLAILPSIDGYTSWTRRELQGFAPGHGLSFRRIYVNDVVESRPATGSFPVGSVIVKEIYALSGTSGAPAPGELRYIAIMRRPDSAAGLKLDAGWLFTRRNDGGTETRGATCFSSCHQQAPQDGVFLTYEP